MSTSQPPSPNEFYDAFCAEVAADEMELYRKTRMTPKGIENLKRARTFEDLLNNPDPLEPAKEKLIEDQIAKKKSEEKLIEDQIAAKSEEARTKRLKMRSGWLTVVDSEAEQKIEKPSDQELLDMIE